MPAPTLAFDQPEYDRRIALTRNAMSKAGIDLLFVTNPSNMHWLTGYDGWSFYVHQGVILPLDRDPIWWGRLMDANGARRTVWMQEDGIRSYPDRYVQASDCHPMQDLAAHLQDLGGQRIGVEMETYYFTARAYQALTEAMPKAEFLDATSLVN